MKRRHSKTLPENACKVLFMSYAFAYVALVSMVLNLQCALQKLWNVYEPVGDSVRLRCSGSKAGQASLTVAGREWTAGFGFLLANRVDQATQRIYVRLFDKRRPEEHTQSTAANRELIRIQERATPDSTTTDQRIPVTSVRNGCSSKGTVQEARREQGPIEPSPNGTGRAQYLRGR
ncbi:hypothetical protein T10_5023 [Trichinella papuae]|uniref:Uncharacterized protein n=1 Tax=Trichinella papuae TaxID=268474 RepID=A0A0V1MV97_9BILA|nr:hypothetical protein T10_5023 [Trichinella papuae]